MCFPSGARRVEEALLPQEHERALGVLAAPDGGFSRDYLLQRPTEVDRSSAQALFDLPGNRAVEREVHLEALRNVEMYSFRLAL